MYTRCTNCRVVLPLAPVDLAQAGGVVRCGSCGRTLNALSELYAYPPGPDATPIAGDGMPPLLTPRAEQQLMPEDEDDVPPAAAIDSDAADVPAFAKSAEPGPILDFSPLAQPAPQWLRWFWPALTLLLTVLLLLQLFGPDRWRVDWSALGGAPIEQTTPDEAVQVVSRDLHAHPTLSDAVVISAVLVNRSEQTVRWPEIQVRLFDASQQVIGERRLLPQDYMDPQADLSSGFAPDVRLPLVLEMVTDASVPTGFSLAFY